MSSIFCIVDGKQDDGLLHSPVIAKARVDGTPVQSMTAARYKALGLSLEQVKSLTWAPVKRVT